MLDRVHRFYKEFDDWLVDVRKKEYGGVTFNSLSVS
jgi:hypothetical protein